MAATKLQPLILYERKHSLQDLNKLRKNSKVWQENDIFTAQLEELFQIFFPKLINTVEYKKKLKQFITEKTTGKKDKLCGNWVYFPWNGHLVHTVNQDDYTRLRTNRNRNLITKVEQKKLLDFNVGIVGLSVGSNVATALAFSGIGQNIKLAEFDNLETTNLNRIRARIDQIGLPKIVLTAEQIYEINPYAALTLYSRGLTKKILDNFVISKPKPKLLFEIIDSFEMKIHLRKLAREQRIPVIMVTNLGDSVILDVERYDINAECPFFNGRAGEVPDTILNRPDITAEDKHFYAVKLAGEKNIPKRALESVEQIGHTLVGRPQLTTTVTIAAGFCGYITRQIALGDTQLSGSWLVKFNEIFSQQSKIVSE